jgi:hypothetical protein
VFHHLIADGIILEFPAGHLFEFFQTTKEGKIQCLKEICRMRWTIKSTKLGCLPDPRSPLRYGNQQNPSITRDRDEPSGVIERSKERDDESADKMQPQIRFSVFF